MSDYPDIAARFACDTAVHQMTVLHDDGLYRHLRFRGAKSSAYWFDLITWPGSLTIRGDIGQSYTFSRLPDMFEFFRSRKGGINVHYWAEKLDGGRSSVQKYDQEIFETQVKEYVVEAIRDGWGPRGIGKAIREEILDSEYLADEHEARKLLEDFEFGVKWRASCSCGDGRVFEDYGSGILWKSSHIRSSTGSHEISVRRTEGLTFPDVWEWSFSDYDVWFVWACYAIVAGIRRYDKVTRYGLTALAAPKAVAS